MPGSPVSTIQAKRDGLTLEAHQIESLIQGITAGAIPDYQASAFLMATYFQGMDLDETVALTKSMLESGLRYDWSDVPGVKVDKHSTGGVGDKISLILAPLAAACGLKVPMMAGRGLGHSGGTIDKLESVTGYNPSLNEHQFREALQDCGCVIVGQSDKIAPADKKLYALRDVTATVDCVPLITASILSKKLAEGAEALVLDLKVGNGAFMKSKDNARKLARSIVQVGKRLGLTTRVIMTNMNQPLGYAIGNSLEVIESIEVLRGTRSFLHSGTSTPLAPSSDVKELTIQLTAHMLEMGKVCSSIAQGRKLALSKLADQSAWKLFLKMMGHHGADLSQLENPEKLPLSKRKFEVLSPSRGFITGMNTEAIGQILVEMGGGRKKTNDIINPGVGILLHKKISSPVKEGEAIATIYAPESSPMSAEQIRDQLLGAISFHTSRRIAQKLILDIL